MPCSNSKYCLRVLVDISLLFIVVGAIYMVKKLWPPFNRGMYCYDKSLTYPYYDHDTISDSVLLFYGVAIPFNLMCIVEFLRTKNEIIGKEFRMFSRRFSSWMWAVYTNVGVFLFGCACSQFLTDVTKYSSGYLRPNFIEVCQPDWSKTNCSTNELSYVDPIPCTTQDASKLKDARLSFPSGHACFSTFTMFYLVMYLQVRLKIKGFRLVRPVLQLGCIVLNVFTCISRLTDYKHHWSDVVAGFLLGASIAVLIAFFVSDLFVKRTTKVGKSAVVMLQDYQSPEETHTSAHNP